MRNIAVFFIMLALLSSCRQPETLRRVLLLNGTWEIARTDSLAERPEVYGSKVPVPGPVDLAVPSAGFSDSLYQDHIYWYRTTFVSPSERSDVALLKINKARYHTRVYLNNRPAGENVLCFTPAFIDLAPYLNTPGQENELVIAVGCKNNLTDTVTDGNDFEKIKYIPGIYDDVQIIFSGYPFISNVQVVPGIKDEKIKVQVTIDAGDILQPALPLSYKIRENVTGKLVAKSSGVRKWPVFGGRMIVDFSIPVKGCRLWSPEDPFLYQLELSTDGDDLTTKFGMRSFSFDKDKKVAVINGKPYYMRGTNVCIFRFFEDPVRKGQPWDARWVAGLHQRFRDMNFNSIRYCIGFPPEKWYEVADSLGFLIQDEYPIWTGGEGGFEEMLPGVTSSRLANEYRQWMQERWNHPCVVIWDANNESVNDTTGKAYQAVRGLDLSNRPWDNGWAAPMEETDCIESHPYLYASNKPVMDLLKVVRIPDNGPNERDPQPEGLRYNNPVIINEYYWMWLNRDGSPTALTKWVYQAVFPEADTPEKRFELHAKQLAMITEYWRAHRQAAAVMYFCGLGYSRPLPPYGQTSDDFIDIDNLVLEPHFVQYVKPAFNPVGVMLDLWDQKLTAGCEMNLPVYVINDTYESWNDSLLVYMIREDDIFPLAALTCQAPALESVRFENKVILPGISGGCTIVAEINYQGEKIKSIREVILE